MNGALQRGEGCNVYGWLQVPRVAGNLHFSGERRPCAGPLQALYRPLQALCGLCAGPVQALCRPSFLGSLEYNMEQDRNARKSCLQGGAKRHFLLVGCWGRWGNGRGVARGWPEVAAEEQGS